MTASTRRRLVVCLIAVALTLPVETILLRAVSSSQTQGARTWAQSLSGADLDAAADNLQSVPPAYRKEVLRQLNPAKRSAAWRAHVYSYIAQHENLDASTQALLFNAASLLTPKFFGNASADERAQATILAEQAVVLIGRDDAENLFSRLGPKAVSVASSRLPMVERLVDFTRSLLVEDVRAEGCDCHTGFGCDAPNHCDGDRFSCEVDDTWPMCGWFYNQECNGLCLGGIE